MIPLEELEAEATFLFCRSSGPGGQHVNKTETKVQVRWNPSRSALLSPDELQRIQTVWANKLLADGSILFESEKTRSQLKNKQDALSKLRKAILEAKKPPVPRKTTRISKAVKERRRKDKEHRSEIKANRRP